MYYSHCELVDQLFSKYQNQHIILQFGQCLTNSLLVTFDAVMVIL